MKDKWKGPLPALHFFGLGPRCVLRAAMRFTSFSVITNCLPSLGSPNSSASCWTRRSDVPSIPAACLLLIKLLITASLAENGRIGRVGVALAALGAQSLFFAPVGIQKHGEVLAHSALAFDRLIKGMVCFFAGRE